MIEIPRSLRWSFPLLLLAIANKHVKHSPNRRNSVMLKNLILVAAITVLTSVGTAHAQHRHNLTNQFGMPIGSLQSRPFGGYSINDNLGMQQGTLQPRPFGGYSINDNFGIPKGYAQPRPFGGYNINDNLGLPRGYAQPRPFGGYQIQRGW